MSLFYNNYQKLQQENAEEIAELSISSWNTLKDMLDYTASFDVSLFELEVIKKDLIGTAREADIEQISLQKKIGVTEKQFCDSLIKGVMEHNKGEVILLLLRKIIFLSLLFYTLNFVLQGFPRKMGIEAWDIFFVFIFCNVEGLLEKHLKSRSIYYQKQRRTIYRTISNLLNVVILITSGVLIFNNIVLFTVRGRVVFGLLILLALIFFFGNNYYWDKCSEKYNWK